MQTDLEVSRDKAFEKEQVKDVLQETIREQRRRLEEVLSLNEDLTIQIQELTATVGYHLTIIDKMKAEVRNAKQRDSNHESRD